MLLGKMVSTIRAGAALLSAVAIIGQEGVCQSKDTAAAPPPAPPAVTVTGFVDTISNTISTVRNRISMNSAISM